MKINTYNQAGETVTSGNVESVACTIKTDDAKLFHILSNLYSRPLNAVIREISTNCLDGHRVVGKENIPFHININNSAMDDEFNISFRDFGPGMDKETIVMVFSRFGESTKINSNLETGCLGLGSKSPYALTDTFLVMSYINNIKYTYSMSKDSSGRPIITLFSESYTDEKNGMEIVVPIDSDRYDNQNITEAILHELWYFKTKPIVKVNGVQRVLFKPKKNYVKICTNVYLKTHDSDCNKIIQGNVSYNFDIRKFINTCIIDETIEFMKISENRISGKTKTIITTFFDEMHFDFYFPIGEISFAPSREELIYDKITINNIGTILFKIINLVTFKFENYIKELKPYVFIGICNTFNNNNSYSRKTLMSGTDISKIFGGKIDMRVMTKLTFEKIRFLNGGGSGSGVYHMTLSDNVSYKFSQNLSIITGDVYSIYKSAKSNSGKITLSRFFKNDDKMRNVLIINGEKVTDNTGYNGIFAEPMSKMGFIFLNNDIKNKSLLREKIKYHLKQHPTMTHIYTLKFENTSTDIREAFNYKIFEVYGVYKKDLNIINPDEITLPKSEQTTSLTDRVVRDKESLLYYPFTIFDRFDELDFKKSRRNIFDQKNKVIHPPFSSDKELLRFKQTTLVIPFDQTKKNQKYITDYIERIIKANVDKSLFVGAGVNYEKILKGLDELSLLRYKDTRNISYRKSLPFCKKTIIVMNEQRAKKLGLVMFDDYFKRYYKKMMNFKHNTEVHIITQKFDEFKVRDLQFFMHFFKDDSIKINQGYLTEKFNFYLDFKKLANENFVNIFSKFYKCAETNEFIDNIDNFIKQSDTIDVKLHSIILPDFIKYLETLVVANNNINKHRIKIKPNLLGNNEFASDLASMIISTLDYCRWNCNINSKTKTIVESYYPRIIESINSRLKTINNNVIQRDLSKDISFIEKLTKPEEQEEQKETEEKTDEHDLNTTGSSQSISNAA